ncbi:MAG: ABC transporter ATP-binding protein/permease [Halothiobacillus sp.]|jgi:ATP-binding cassette subfamily B protein|nr:ABC transporter ATP-binding protein/permease [Halothiobacillus sp.]
MRHFGSNDSPPGAADWRTLKLLLPYLWEFKWRVLIALSFLIGAKFAIVSIPIVLKHIVDNLNQPKAVLVVPLALLFGYGALRLASTMFADLRDIVFAKVTQRAIRRVGMDVFRYLHSLSLRFHLERQTGGVARDIERGAQGISSLLSMVLFSILPTLIEIGLVAGILFFKFDWTFAAITLTVVAVYVALTILITEWRTKLRRRMNEMDSKANTQAVDSLLNYETVKYFGNEAFEAARYDESLQNWEVAAVKNQTSIGVLNVAQAFVIAIGMTIMLILASRGVVEGKLTVGDLVMVNAFLIQMFIPLNFMGVIYRQIKQSLTDIERLFTLLDVPQEIKDKPTARPLELKGGEVRFVNVHFGYDPDRQILHGVDFTVPAGHNVAIVGASGAGKSTLSRLLFRFYDVTSGEILIDGQDIRDVTQASLRAAIGIVPQDTVLFNSSIYFNIAYGRPTATREEVIEAARAAHILSFIESLPKGWETTVGERGLKLSGGEKQRVAIARTLLKNPQILIFDEATSALDTQTEKNIQFELKEISRNRSTITIAHRLSTIIDVDEILVMERGQIVERGNHRSLLAHQGVYAELWAMQQEARDH